MFRFCGKQLFFLNIFVFLKNILYIHIMNLKEKKSELSDLIKPSQPLKKRLRFAFKYWVISKAIIIVDNGLEDINKK